MSGNINKKRGAGEQEINGIVSGAVEVKADKTVIIDNMELNIEYGYSHGANGMIISDSPREDGDGNYIGGSQVSVNILNNVDLRTSFFLGNSTDFDLWLLVPPYNPVPDDFISMLTIDTPTSGNPIMSAYTSGMIFSGDDCESGVWVPELGRHYTIVFWYDGQYINAAVRSVER